MSRDVAAVVQATLENTPVILVGHSMGGAVAVRAAPLITNLSGLGVIDVVEGTAMDALASMQSFLRSRPSSFSSISQAIEWWLVFLLLCTLGILYHFSNRLHFSVRSGQIRNVQSAKVSVPGQIKKFVYEYMHHTAHISLLF